MLVESEKLNALIVDPGREQRNKLKLLLTHIEFYAHVGMVDSIRDAQTFLSSSEHSVDAIYVSSAYDSNAITDLIEQSHLASTTECSVFILLLGNFGGPIATVADAFMVGAHACLSEPYSVENVREVTEHARKLGNQLRDARDRTVIKLILQDAVKYVDAVALRLQLDSSPYLDLNKLRELGKTIGRLHPRAHELYFDMLVDKFEKAPMPYYLPGVQNYTGKSKATQRRAARERERLKHEAAEAKEGVPQPKRTPKAQQQQQQQAAPSGFDASRVLPPKR